MSWIKKDSDIREILYNMNKNDTFAIKYSGGSLEHTKYATIEKVYKNSRNYYETSLGEPYNIICEIILRKDPSSDYKENKQLAYDKGEKVLYLKKNIGDFRRVSSISTEPLKVSYSTGSIFALCKECGSKTKIDMEESPNASTRNRMIKNNRGDLVTPCCRSDNWVTKHEKT